MADGTETGHHYYSRRSSHCHITGVDENTFERELKAIKRARASEVSDMIHQESVRKETYAINEEEIQAEADRVRKRKMT